MKPLICSCYGHRHNLLYGFQYNQAQLLELVTSTIISLKLHHCTPFPCPPLTIPNRENTTDLSWLLVDTFFLITTGGQTWYHYNSISWTIWNLIFILHYWADPKIMERYSESYIIFQQHQKTESTLLKLIFINQRHYKKICENDWHNEVITLCKTSRN